MGCGSSHSDTVGPVRISTVTGWIKVTITSAHLNIDSGVFKFDPYVILKLSNQKMQTKIIPKGGV